MKTGSFCANRQTEFRLDEMSSNSLQNQSVVLLNWIYSEFASTADGYLEPSRTYTVELFSKNNLAVNYFRIKAPS